MPHPSRRNREPRIASSILNLIGLTIFIVLCSGLLAPNAQGQQNPKATVDFRRDILPVLSDKCYTCHGPDAATREGEFRFDVKESAFGEADSGRFPIVPGDLEASEMIRRIFATGSSRMPPKREEKQLSATEIELLKNWVKEGANWDEHWAFVAPRMKQPVDIKSDWPVHELDKFVLSEMQKEGLEPQPEANKATLIRRVTLDLTGLPPTPQEIDTFLSDDSENAYEKVVDRLLASPQYGEQMAARWLDAARFADTNGYQNDFSREMWPWRDWVIRAYNENKPFDDFTVEQIAGDMLPDATLDQKIATGFNRNHRTVTEGGSIEQEWLVENVVDRVETTSTVFLGLTMGCARCHDHKYDPISQEEFYQFFSYFYNVDELGFHNERRGNVPPLVKITTPEVDQRLADLAKQINNFDTKIESLKESLVERQQAWQVEFSKKQSIETRQDFELGILTPSKTLPPSIERLFASLQQKSKESNDNKKLYQFNDEFLGQVVDISGKPNSHVKLGDADLSSVAEFDGSKSFSVSVWARAKKFGAILSRMDAKDNYRGFDMLITPTGQLNVHLVHQWPRNAIKVTTKNRIPRARWTHVAVSYNGSGKAGGLKIYFNGLPVEFEINSDSLNGTTLTEHPLWIGRRAFTPPFGGKVSDIRVFDDELSKIDFENIFESGVQRMVLFETEESSDRDQALKEIFRDRYSDDFAKAVRARDRAKLEQKQIRDKAPTTMVMAERDKPRKCYVLNRGMYDQPDKSREVFPAVPAFLPQPKNTLPKNRLGLAYWLVDSQNPLTARVAVNRYWQHYFGYGLLESQENFGVQSPQPLQIDLLDHLALKFIDMDWDIKKFQRYIVTSATYRQSSSASAENYQRDPKNQWLARGPRMRLSSEQIRDNALAIAGILNTETIGGPSIKPYQPDGLWRELAGGAGQGPYKQDMDDRIYRRSLYIYRKRTVPHPTMTTFDAGSREICQVSRPRTNTPLQALALLNDTTYVEAARELAVLVIKNEPKDDARIELAFKRATARPPTGKEREILQNALNRYRVRFQSDKESAEQLIATGQSQPDSDLDPIELAAFTSLASIILNLDETITKE